jgi:hypothetical protein
VLWNPLNINPELSDMESEDEYHPSHEPPSFPSKKKHKIIPKEDVYEIDYDGGDTLNGSHDDDNTIQSERFLKMSHISTKKSNSTSSNIQDCQELVNGLENGRSCRHFDNQQRSTTFEGNGSDKCAKEAHSLPSCELNSKLRLVQNETKGEITFITSKIMPEQDCSQMQIYEIITNSKDLTNTDILETQFTLTNCGDKSEETTQITRINSESQKSNCSQNDRMSGIDIVKNYSFVHELDYQNDTKVNSNVNKCQKMISPSKNKKSQLKKNFEEFQKNPKKLNEENNKIKDPNLNNTNKIKQDIEVLNLQYIKKKTENLNQNIKNEKKGKKESFN